MKPLVCDWNTNCAQVAPLWERGLKPRYIVSDRILVRRSLMGAWIETCVSEEASGGQEVAPLWERGLKLVNLIFYDIQISRSLMGAWIETPLLHQH